MDGLRPRFKDSGAGSSAGDFTPAFAASDVPVGGENFSGVDDEEDDDVLPDDRLDDFRMW